MAEAEEKIKTIFKLFSKPLFPVGDITAVEHIVNNFSKYGVKKFFKPYYKKFN